MQDTSSQSDLTDPEMPDLISDTESENLGNFIHHDDTAAYHHLVEFHTSKGLFDDCQTIGHMISRLQEKLDYLKGKELVGWTLKDPVQQDIAFIVAPDIDINIPESMNQIAY